MVKEFDVIVAGYLCMDLTPDFKKEQEPFKNLMQFLKPGKLIEVDTLEFTLGGVVGTTGVLLQKFNRTVFLNALIGDDLIGKMVMEKLAKYKLITGVKVIQKKGTAFGIVLAFPGIDRIFLESPGCNKLFDRSYIDFEAIAKSRVFHFGYPPLLRQFYKNDGEQLADLFATVQQMGVVTSLDFSLPDTESESGKLNWSRIMKKTLPYTDVFMPSLEEALFIMMPTEYEKLRKEADKEDIIDYITPDIIREVGKCIMDYGVKVLLIKAGHKGLYLLTGCVSSINEKANLDLDKLEWNQKELWADAYVVDSDKIVNASGAGDTAVAAFLSAMIDNVSPQKAMKYAAIAGRNSLYCHDIAGEIADWNEMTEELEADNLRIHAHFDR